jgi:hypothetical protein
MSKMVAFKADDAEAVEIDAYCKARHFHSLPEFARVAIFAYIRQNKPGSHRPKKHTAQADRIALYAGGRHPPLHLAGDSEGVL